MVLVISLIFLMLLTLIGVAGSQVSSLQTRMAGNQHNRNLAFQAAEAALRQGEVFLQQANLPAFSATGNDGLYALGAATPTAFGNWNDFTSRNTEGFTHVATQPRFIIQRMPDITGGASNETLDVIHFAESEMYQITAYAVGGDETAVVVLQSIYRR
ncbi:MAG: PilX N-terminal domain-containing pilus assembly protein [Methylococcales bacterium]|nr:PilX N-terminal domain-containing pilus assembly protein [Methylococcales bacterium]